MSDRHPREAILDLLWSLWTELGVPGPSRRHTDCIIDPEPLILHTTLGGDARLDGLALAWCARHAERLSAARMSALHRRAEVTTRASFAPFGRAMARTRVGKSWPHDAGALDGAAVAPSSRDVGFPISERPALVAFRIRALVGVGARADVVTRLLYERGWALANAMDDLAYTRRNVDRVLAELLAAGVLEAGTGGATREVRLARPAALALVVGAAETVRVVSWSGVFSLVTLAMRLTELEQEPRLARQLQASRIRGAGIDLAKRLGIEGPPVALGEQDRVETLRGWATAALEALADGTSSAFQRRTVA